jgi:sugar-specific transcriptional regulator TrmB
MEAAVLEQLGLSKTEAKVYLALLSLGSATGSEIAEKADVFRRNAYDALNKLIERGLVSSIIKDKTYYSVAPPEKLQDVLKEKEDSLEAILPKLHDLYTHPKIRQKVFVFEGREGIKTVLNEIIKEGRDWLAFGSSGASKQVFGDWVDYWERMRAKAGIKTKIIMDDNPAGRKRGKKIAGFGLARAKIYAGPFASPVSTYVFGNRMAFVFWSEVQPLAILVDNKEIADATRKYFNALWKVAKSY